MKDKPEKLIIIVNESAAGSLVKDAGTFLLFAGLLYFNHRALAGSLWIDTLFIFMILMGLIAKSSSRAYSGPKAGAIEWLKDK